MKKESVIIGFTFLVYATTSVAAIYDTLPKGVNMFVLKQVMTSKIESKIDSNHQEDSLSFKENFTSSKLEDISEALQTYFRELRAISPDAYNSFSLGEFSAEAYAQVSAQGLGLARGMTDRLTLYGSVPIYHIKTVVDFHQSKKSNLGAIQAAILNAPTDSAFTTFIKQLTLQLPETNEQLLQSLVVNHYKYKPLGNWEKDALGDAELGGIYRLTNFDDKGMALALGVVLPTGDADDPDSLQDVSTGDGQYDAFIESMEGIGFFDNTFQLDLKTRLTYQFAAKKDLRALDDPHMPLTVNKESMKEKLGNKIDAAFTATINATRWLNFNSSFIYNQTGPSTIEARDPRVKAILESNTESTNQWARVGIGLSSIELYKAHKMDVPCELNFSAQKLLNAKNSANYTRYDLDFRLYF